MSGIELAVAYVSVVPSTRDFERKLKSELKGQGVDIDVDADTTGATKNMDRWRTTEERKPLDVKTEADTGGASADLARWRAVEGRNKVNIAVDADTRDASNQLGGLRRDIEMLGRSDALRLNIGAAALTSLPMLAAGLAEVAAALQQVAQAALAVPGGIAGAVSSIGTLAFGLSGAKDAYDALGKASDDAATSGGDMADSARAQMSASFSLRNAIVDEAQARKDVAQATRDARQELTDLNLEMRGGVLSEKRAILEAKRAREELAKGGFKSASDVQDALLRIEEADQRVLEVRSRNARTANELADANAKGIANADGVVAASERLTRAQQQVQTAQSGVAASAPKVSAAQENAALAMSKLHPEVRELVQAAFAFTNGPGADLRNMLGGKIANGLSEQITGLSRKALPTFEKGMGRIAETWNATFNELFDVLGKDQNLSLVDRILGNTADAQSRLNGVIDPLVEGIGVLTAAGTDALPRLADGLAAVSERFANFITAADADGRLDKWINDGITAMGHLGETVLNVGKMFTAITNSTGPTSLLATISDLTGKWQGFLNSAEGQQTLQSIWAEGEEMFNRWKPILEDLPDLFLALYDAAKMYMGPLLELLNGVTSVLADHPGLVQLAAGAYVAFKGAQVLGAIGTLSTALTGVNDILGDPGGKGGKGGKGMLGRLAIAGTLLAALQIGATNPVLNDQNVNAAIDSANNGNQQPVKDIFGQIDSQMNGNGKVGTNAPTGPLDTSGTSVLPGILNGQQPPAVRNGGDLYDMFKPSSGGSSSTGNPLLDLLQGKTPAGQGAAFNGKRPVAGSYGLPAGTDTGGYGTGTSAVFPPWVMQIADTFGIKPSTYAGHQESNRNEAGYAPNPNGLNRGIDWSGPVANMQRFADYLRTVPGMEQVIWQNPNTGQAVEIAGGRPQPGYFSGDLAGHQNHVHTRQSTPIPLPVKPYDQGGKWPSGTMGINLTGKDEYVLTPEDLAFLKKNNIDPASLPQGINTDLGPVEPGRTEGYIPAAAGSTAKAGNSPLAGIIGMGAEVINGLIDQAASAASTAAAAGLAAGTMGAGAAGAPAAAAATDAAIGMATGAAKRGVQWGADILGILADSVVEQVTPFGAPRWLGSSDPTAFMPNLDIMPALTTTLEEGVQAAAQQSAVDPNTTEHGAGMGAPPGPQAPAVPQPVEGAAALSQVAKEASNWAPPPQPAMVNVERIEANDAKDVAMQIAKQQRLEAMRFAGRP